MLKVDTERLLEDFNNLKAEKEAVVNKAVASVANFDISESTRNKIVDTLIEEYLGNTKIKIDILSKYVIEEEVVF